MNSAHARTGRRPAAPRWLDDLGVLLLCAALVAAGLGVLERWLYAGVGVVALALLAGAAHALRRYHVAVLARTRRESESRVRQLAANAADVMFRFRLQPDRGFEFLNPAVQRVMGYTPEQCYENPALLLDRIHPEDQERVEQLLREPLVGGPFSVRWQHPDGGCRRFELITMPSFGAAGRVIALDGIARDVTQEAEKDRALRESEARHRALFETTHQGIISRELESGRRILNPAARQILGVAAEEGDEACLAHLVFRHADGRLLEGSEHSSAIAARTAQAVEPRLLQVLNRRTGQTHWLLSGAVPMVREGENRPYLVYTVFTDITAIREAETELRDTREMYRAVVENTTDVIARFDRDCRYLYINPSCLRYAPFSPADLIGRTHLEAGHDPEVSRKWDTTIRAVFADGQPRSDSYTLPGPQGLQHFAWRLFPEFDSDGSVKTVVTWSSDITAQRLLEAQYQQAQKMEAVGRLAGGVAHDFNNLITAISGYAMMVKEQLPAGASAREDVEEIARAGERAAALTRQLLAFSRKQVLKVDVLDLGEVVRSMDKMLRRLIGEDVTLELSIADVVWPVLADAGQIEQVIMNLSVNARDAMPGGGTLSIGVRNRVLTTRSRAFDPYLPPGQYVAISVTDTGIGMPPATLEHLFEPFFTTKEKGKGTGLGLSTVYGIVRQSDGAIRVQSGPDAGTTFEILLPRTARAPHRASDGAVHPPPSESRECILVVEDEPAVRTLTQRLLERAGYTVRVAESGAAALALALDRPIDLLLTDVVMPGMSGRDLARAFCQRHPHTRVLFMSGYTDEVIASHGLLEPGVSLLQKPFDARTLQQAVRATLGQTAALW